MKPASAIFQILKKKILGALLLVVCVSGLTMAQSVLSDDAHTSTLPKDLDTNFGTNPSLTVSATNTTYLKFMQDRFRARYSRPRHLQPAAAEAAAGVAVGVAEGFIQGQDVALLC